MTSPLTDEQRELLSAFADEEVTDAERQTAEKLLEREDARGYLASLRATAQLVATHASVSAPVGLSGRVMSELQNDLKPKAGKLHTIPTLSWQTPLWAAAAVVVVSLAIMFGPSLISPKPAPDAGVARGVLDDLPPDHSGDSLSATPPDAEKPSGEALFTTSDDPTDDREIGGGSGGRVLERMSRDRTGGAAEDATEEIAGLKGESEKLAGKLAKEGLDEFRGSQSPKTDSANAEGQSDAGDAPKSGRSNGWGPADSNEADGKNSLEEAEEKQADKRDQDEAEREKKNDPAPPPPPPPAMPAKEPAAQPNNGEEHEADPEGASRRDELDDEVDKTKVKPNSRKLAEDEEPGEDAAKDGEVRRARAEPEQSKAGSAAEPLEVDIAGAGSLKGQTDVLWVSSLYGDAGLSDDDSDIENVSVEIDRDKLPELLAALRKLAKDQGYGAVDGEEASPDANGQGHRISGYLPADEPATSTEPTTKEKPERVTVIIRLK